MATADEHACVFCVFLTLARWQHGAHAGAEWRVRDGGGQRQCLHL